MPILWSWDPELEQEQEDLWLEDHLTNLHAWHRVAQKAQSSEG